MAKIDPKVQEIRKELLRLYPENSKELRELLKSGEYSAKLCLEEEGQSYYSLSLKTTT